MKKLIFGILFLSSFAGLAQQIPMRISLFNEATAIPFSQFFTEPIHPGIQIGRDFDWKQNGRFHMYPTVSLSYLFHNKLYQAIAIQGELKFDYQFDFGLNLKSSVGLSAMYTISTQDEFQFKNGSYRNAKDGGNLRAMPSISIGLGQRIKPADPFSTEVFVMYQAWVEYPYSPGFIPAMTHTNLHLGTKFFINKHNSTSK